MDRAPNVRRIAADLRERALQDGTPLPALAPMIAERCGITLLAAMRNAHGWSQQLLADKVNALREGSAEITFQQVSDWERDVYTPGISTIMLLCRIYDVGPVALGFAEADETSNAIGASPRRPHAAPSIAAEHPRRSPPAAPAQYPLERYMPELDQIRKRLATSLRIELSETAVDHLERRVRNYHVEFTNRTSAGVLVDVARDVQEAQDLLESSHTPEIQRRLLTVLTHLTGMLGFTMLFLGDPREADSWFVTAELAADQTADRELRAWVKARRALVPLYHGNIADTIILATEAANLAGARPTAAGARALTIQAMVLSKRPDEKRNALAAADRARTMHAELSGVGTEDGILGITSTQMAVHLGEVYTNLGDSTRAFEQQAQVLDRITGTSPIGCIEPDGCLDPTLTRLDMAACHIQDGEVEHGLEVALQAVLAIPHTCFGPLILKRLSSLAVGIPKKAQSSQPYQELRDVLAFSRSSSI